MRFVLSSATVLVPCVQGVGCGGGENPEDALPFIHSAREGQKGREDMQKMLLHFAELPNVQVSGFLCWQMTWTRRLYCFAILFAAVGSLLHAYERCWFLPEQSRPCIISMLFCSLYVCVTYSINNEGHATSVKPHRSAEITLLCLLCAGGEAGAGTHAGVDRHRTCDH